MRSASVAPHKEVWTREEQKHVCSLSLHCGDKLVGVTKAAQAMCRPHIKKHNSKHIHNSLANKYTL